VEEYLVQFEITAKHNEWTTDEKALALLQALDGTARGIYNQFSDPANASYKEIKQALVKRFGSTDISEVHEHAISQLRLARDQQVRELAHDVTRLTRKANPDLSNSQLERFAIKNLLRAISDRDAVFYIKDKNPTTLDEACTIYERYQALIGADTKRSSIAARAVRSATDNEASSANDLLRSEISRLREDTNRQVQSLTEEIRRLNSTTITRGTNQSVEVARSSANDGGNVPKKPCPQCHRTGHWKSDCPQLKGGSTQCFECKEFGHRWRNCPQLQQGNGRGPTSAPNSRSTEPAVAM